MYNSNTYILFLEFGQNLLDYNYNFEGGPMVIFDKVQNMWFLVKKYDENNFVVLVKSITKFPLSMTHKYVACMVAGAELSDENDIHATKIEYWTFEVEGKQYGLYKLSLQCGSNRNNKYKKIIQDYIDY